jgi:hypothetical protein
VAASVLLGKLLLAAFFDAIPYFKVRSVEISLPNRVAVIGYRERIALIAHDHQKQALPEWVRFNKGTLLQHELCATGQRVDWAKSWIPALLFLRVGR